MPATHRLGGDLNLRRINVAVGLAQPRAGHRDVMLALSNDLASALMMVLVARFTGIADLAALIGVFALTTSMILFGLLMERQQRDYRFGEVVYMLLGLGTKSALAWLVFANVLRS